MEDPESGELHTLEDIETNNIAHPYVAVIDDVFLIGPLAIQVSPHGWMHSINLEYSSVIPNFVKEEIQAEAKEKFISEAKEKRAGEYLSLNSLRAPNFWHWMMEAMIKVVMALECGFKGYFIIPPHRSSTRFVKESLELVGIDKSRFIPYDGEPWWIETLYVPQAITGVHELMNYPGMIARLRKKFLDAIGEHGGPFERVYIARDDPSKPRRIVNEMELMGVLERYDFERVILENLPLRDQIGMVINARCLVGPHGAGMVHCLFMQPESLVIELFSPHYIHPCMMAAIEYLKHRYFVIPSLKYKEYKYGDDIEAYTALIDLTLKRELGFGQFRSL